jgi:hypothetical protein
MKKALFVLPAAEAAQTHMVQAATRQITEAKRKLRFARSVKTIKLLNMFSSMAATCGGDLTAYVGAHYVNGQWKNGNWINGYDKPAVQARIRIRDLDSFKDDRLVGLLGMIEASGLEGLSRDYTHSEEPNRDYAYETDDFTLIVDARVKSDSASCRRVKTGETTRMVVDEEWKIECD